MNYKGNSLDRYEVFKALDEEYNCPSKETHFAFGVLAGILIGLVLASAVGVFIL